MRGARDYSNEPCSLRRCRGDANVSIIHMRVFQSYSFTYSTYRYKGGDARVCVYIALLIRTIHLFDVDTKMRE